MTPEEIQEIVDLVLQAIRTNSKTIEQLTEAFSVGNADYFELSGGRKISFATLAEFIETQGGLITTDQIADGAVTEAKTSFIKVVSDNMLNKADVLEGKLINSSTGALVNIQSIFTANYIPVKPSTDYWWLGTQTAYGYAFYDANKQLLTYGSKGTENDQNKPGHATSPEGAAYLRVSFPNGQIDTAQVNEGSWKTHDEYRFGIDDNLLPGDTLPIDGARIINNTVTPDKTTFFVTKRSSINLYNPAAATEGKYIVATTGALADASTLCVSDYIPVKPGTEYFYYGRQRSYGYAFYDSNKSRIAFGAKGTENDNGIGSKVAPEGAAYIRITFRIADNGTNEVNEGIPYLSKIPSQLDSIMGQQGSFASAASLASGGELALGTFPVYISKQLCMVFGCKFSTFASVTLGQRNGYITVDGQNVYVYGNLSTGGFGLRQTVAHNLTISNYIRLMLFVEGTKVTDTTMNASLVVSTATGYTVIKLNSWYYTHGGEVYASVGQASTEASIGATCIDFRSPVWAFGDSYFGLSPARWPYVMRELGYFNYYFEGLGGGTSYDMYHEMERAIKFGTPRYLLWCLGMNDQDPDNTTPSANWLAVFGHIKDYCSENGVQLILATIPNTPTRRNYAKNEVVKASGYRYIDFAKAVGAENAGSSWYTGMLHTDNVHPTELGAQALATQVLIDFPELMEICKTPAVGGGGGDPIDAYTKAEADARFVQPTYVDDKVNAAQGQMVFRDAYSQNIFTSDDVPAGNTISLKYVPLASGSANVIVYDTSGAVLKRFELSSVVAGQEYTFDDYVLPDTYARVYVTNYQHLNVYVTVVGWSNKALFEALKNIGGDEIYVGTTEPTDPNIKLWLNPNENFVSIEQTTGDSEVAVMSQKAVTEAIAGAGGGKASAILRPFDDVQTAYTMTAMDFATGTFTINGAHDIAVNDWVTIIPNFKIQRTYSNLVTQRLNRMVNGAYPCEKVTSVDGNNIVVGGFVNASQSALTANQWLIVKHNYSEVIIELPEDLMHKEISIRIQGFTTKQSSWNNNSIFAIKGKQTAVYTNRIVADTGHGSYLDDLYEFYMDRAIRYDMSAICRMDTTGSYRTNYVVVQGNTYNMADTDHIVIPSNLCMYGNIITIKEL